MTRERGVALVTGGSAGIGAALAEECAADGYDVVLVGRRQERLEAVAGDLRDRYRVAAHPLVNDLAVPGSADALMTTLEQNGWGPVEVLINNAGFGSLGDFADVPLSVHREMIQVDVAALTDLAWHALHAMIPRRRGWILNVASTAAFQPGPRMAVYYAAKSYVLSLSLALAHEASLHDVTVSALCPGPVRTGFQARAGMSGSRMLKSPMMDSRTVARVGYRGLRRGRRLIVPGLLNKMLAQSTRLAPRRLAAAVAGWVQGPVSGPHPT